MNGFTQHISILIKLLCFFPCVFFVLAKVIRYIPPYQYGLMSLTKKYKGSILSEWQIPAPFLTGCLYSIGSVIAYRHRCIKRRRFYSTSTAVGRPHQTNAGGVEMKGGIHKPLPGFVIPSGSLRVLTLFSFALYGNTTENTK